MQKKSLFKILIALAPLSLALPFAMDIYVPAIPHITKEFHTTPAIMQLTLNLFMLFSGIAQLFIGPLTDRYGRRRCVFSLIVIFTLGTLLCSLATGVTSLIFGRLIQAFGSCGLIVLSFTIARDLLDGTQLAQCYSLLNGIISFSPMFAPFIGAYLDLHFGWQATFEVLFVISILASLCYFIILKESWPESKRIKINLKLLLHYANFSRNKIFLLYTFSAAFGLSYLFIFCATSPIILISLLHVPEYNYGYYFCFMGISFFLGSLFSAYIVDKIGIYNTVKLGFIISFIGGLIMALWYTIGGLSVGNYVIPMILIGIGGTCSMGAGSAGSVTPYKDQAGLASSFSTAIRFFFNALIGLIISQHINSSLPLALPSIVFSLIGLVLFHIFRHSLRSIGT